MNRGGKKKRWGKVEERGFKGRGNREEEGGRRMKIGGK